MQLIWIEDEDLSLSVSFKRSISETVYKYSY